MPGPRPLQASLLSATSPSFTSTRGIKSLPENLVWPKLAHQPQVLGISVSRESSTSAWKRHAGHQLSARLGSPRSVTGDGGGKGRDGGEKGRSGGEGGGMGGIDESPTRAPYCCLPGIISQVNYPPCNPPCTVRLYLERGTRGGRHFNLSTSAYNINFNRAEFGDTYSLRSQSELAGLRRQLVGCAGDFFPFSSLSQGTVAYMP